MKNKGEMRWLQLSDLHMFQSAEVEAQKKALYRQFLNEMTEKLQFGNRTL